MIKRINQIRKFGVFKDYRRGGTIQDFQKLNIIYGWNYSGKTTLSRLFQCFDKQAIHEDYKNCEFEVLGSDDTRYSQRNLVMPGKQVGVFNSDFVRKNLKWDGESFDAILLLGEESIETEKQIEKKKGRVEKAEKLERYANTVYTTLNSDIESKLTEQARLIKTQLNLVGAFDKGHLRPIIEQVITDHTSYIISVQNELNRLLREATASLEDKLPELPEINLDLRLSNLISEVEQLVGETPAFSQTIEYLVKNHLVASWVQEGLPLHADKNKCEFCGNNISTERIKALNAHFSEDLRKHQGQIDTLVNALESSKIQPPVRNERELYSSIRDRYKAASGELKLALSNYNKELDKLIRHLKAKKAAPFEVITDISNVNNHSQIVRDKCQSLNTLIAEHNKQTFDFEAGKNHAIKRLKNHFAASLINNIELLAKKNKIEIYKSREQNLKSLKNVLDGEVRAMEAQISNAQRGREKLNEYIQMFLGREEIKVEVVNEGENERFTLRRQSEKAVNLSEGEKTAIAFSFFLTKLEEIPDLSQVIVYIDDPISSLDSNHIFQVNALLKNFFFTNDNQDKRWELKCEQLFISTHNFEFFSLLRELPKLKRNGNPDFNFYFVKRNHTNGASLDQMPKSIKAYTSEYHYLFNVLYSYHQLEDKDEHEDLLMIPNAIRRFVELYTYSKMPTAKDVTVDHRADAVFDKIKSKRILKVLHYFSHANNMERMVKNNDFVCDLENAIADLMEELQKDTLHYQSLVESVQT